MKNNNTVITDQGIEVYESDIYRLVDEYISTVLQVSPEDYDTQKEYRSVSKSGTFSPLHDKEPQTFAKYDINQLREIAEHLLTYCNAQERGCKDACGKNCEP